jgi:3-phosphoshikimate 1-carboxyvinyltransferase
VTPGAAGVAGVAGVRETPAHGATGAPPAPWSAPVAAGPVSGRVRLPGSKSMTARALVLAALAESPSTLHAPLRARDTELMAGGLRALGTNISTEDDERWPVRPEPLHGPAHVDVGLAGTVMRFLPPVAALATGSVTFDGDPWARHRPLQPLVEALQTAGVDLTASERGGLPLTVNGTGRVAGGELALDAAASSQFVSALLLVAPRFARGVVVRHVGAAGGVPSRPHLRMTAEMLRAAGATVDDSEPDVWVVEPGPLAGRAWQVEPDLSGAAPFLAAALVTGGEVTVPGWPAATTQPGDQLRSLLEGLGASCTLTADGLTVRGTGAIHGIDVDLSDVSELTPVVAAVCALADTPSRLSGVAHIRGHETDRLSALARELSGLGAGVTETGDGLVIVPRPLRGAVFETYDDHRLAHAAAVVGLVVPGVSLSDVACTAKTLPEFPAMWTNLVRG